MSDPIFNQGFVYCFVCHRRHSAEYPLRLTSCAHILCTSHIDNSNECPVCNARHISVIELSERRTLPSDVLSYFLPLPELAETLYNASQFQQQALANQIQYYQDHVVKLREKVARQQQLLYKAKKELETVSKLKHEVASLEKQLQERAAAPNTTSKFFDTRRRSSSMSTRDIQGYSTPAPPMTVDLTLDDSMGSDDTFLTKLKRTTPSLKGNALQNKGQYVSTAPQESTTKTSHASGYTARRQNSGNLAAESTHLSLQRFAHSPSNIGVGNPSSLQPNTSSSPIHTNLLRSSQNMVSKPREQAGGRNQSTTQTQNRFPQSLSSLRIIKRNNTTSNDTNTAPRTLARSKQGIVAHMRSSTSTAKPARGDKSKISTTSTHPFSHSQNRY